MKFVLGAGAELETLTPGEFDSLMGKHTKTLADQITRADTMIESQTKITVPADGVIPETEVWRCPVGFIGYLHRLEVSADGFTPGAPLTTAGAWLSFWRDTPSPFNLVYPLPVGNDAVLPCVITEGGYAAKMIRHGQLLIVTGSLGSTSDGFGMYVNAQIRLQRDHGREIATSAQ